MFYVGYLEERNGEYLYKHTMCFVAEDPVMYLDTMASQFYDEAGGEQEGEGYYFYGGDIFVTPGKFMEVSEEVYTSLCTII